MPYAEETSLHNLIDFEYGPAADENDKAIKAQISFFICPSDGSEDRLNSPRCIQADERWLNAGRTNYHGNGGSDTGQSKLVDDLMVEQNNGVFVTNLAVSTKHITDGTSNTVMYAEALRGDGDQAVAEGPGDWFRITGQNQTVDQVYQACSAVTSFASYVNNNQFSCRGRNWGHGDYTTTRYNHVMPPNAHGCSQTSSGSVDAIPINEDGGATTASSRHNGGVNVAFADSSLRFINDSIDIMVWRAIGSRAGEEVVDF
jgi:prepilin-type processing-associated H-X9-DG protein